jgi:hypothetical protein
MDLGDVELLRDEEVLWSGAPRHHPIFGPDHTKPILSGLAWCGLGVLIAGLAFRFGEPAAAIGGVGSALFGLYESVGSRLVWSFILRQTAYAVTDRRVVIVTRFVFRRERSVVLSDLTPLSVTAGSGGLGTVFFFGAAGAIRFRDIEDADRVRNLIVATQAGKAA